MHAGPYGEKKSSLSSTTSGRLGPIETDDLSGPVLDGLDQLWRGVHEDFRAHAQQARGVIGDLRARNLRLERAATLLGFDAAEEGCKLEALPDPLGNPRLDGVVGNLQMYPVERRRQQLAQERGLILAHRPAHEDVPPKPVERCHDVLG